LPFDPSRLPQPLRESRQVGLERSLGRNAGHQHADAPYAVALLRACRQRPDRLIYLREQERFNIGFTIQVDTLCYKLQNFVEKCWQAV
jgi:hypothetical protein